MAHPYNHIREKHPGQKRAHSMAKHFKRGGAAKHEDETEDKKLIKKEISKHVKHADLKACGGEAHSRKARGGGVKHKKGHTHINILVAPKGGDATGAAPPAPPISPGDGGGPPMMPPPKGGPPMGMGGPPGIGGPPGMPPGGPGGLPMRKRGGRTGMEYGAGSGEGRLEKKGKYGKGK